MFLLYPTNSYEIEILTPAKQSATQAWTRELTKVYYSSAKAENTNSQTSGNVSCLWSSLHQLLIWSTRVLQQ